MFTDGLVEGHGEKLDEDLTRLRDALADLAGAPLDELCDPVLDRVAVDSGDDDIALVAVRAYSEDRATRAQGQPTVRPLESTSPRRAKASR